MLLKRFSKKTKKADIKNIADDVGCFGKLPLHNEFIKYAAHRPESINLIQWHQSAFDKLRIKYGSQTKTMFSSMPLYHFCFYNSHKQDPLIGTIIASQDQSGRCYPYVQFRSLRSSIAHEFQTAIPLLYQDYFNSNQQLYKYSWDKMQLPNLYNIVKQSNQYNNDLARHSALTLIVEQLKKHTFDNYWNPISRSHPQLQLSAFIQFTLTTLSSIQPSLEKLSHLCLRIPLPQGNLSPIYIVFWLQLIGAFISDQNIHVQTYWNSTPKHHKATLLIFFNNSPPTNFFYLVEHDFCDEHLLDIINIANDHSKIVDNPQEFACFSPGTLLATLDKWSNLKERIPK